MVISIKLMSELSASEKRAVQDLRDCVCHSRERRGRFHAVLNTISGIPVRQLRRLRKLVCLCSTTGDYLDKFVLSGNEASGTFAYPKVLEHVQGLSRRRPPLCYEALCSINQSYEDFLKEASQNRSCARLLMLLNDALSGNYSLFADADIITSRVTIDDNATVPDTRVTSEQTDSVRTKNATLKIKIYINKSRTPAIRYFQSGRSYINIRRMKWYPKVKKEPNPEKSRPPRRYCPHDVPESDKEARRATYDLKHSRDRAGRGGTERKGRKRRSKGGRDDEGESTAAETVDAIRCTNCRQKYRSCDRKAPCRYHPEYLLSGCNRWMCCSTAADDIKNEQDKINSHRKTGCVIGSHNWKAVKQSGAKKRYWRYPTNFIKLQYI